MAKQIGACRLRAWNVQRVHGREKVSFDGHTALVNAHLYTGSQEREIGFIVSEINREQEVRNELF